MAHVRESFPILEDASGEGTAVRQIIAGDSTAAKNGLLGFSFKDSSGNAVLPTLTPEGKVPVDFEGAGVPKDAAGSVAGSLTQVLVCEVALNTSKTHGKIHANISCFREAVFELIQLDDVTSTVIGRGIVGPGQYSFKIDLGAKEIISGASGTQKLQLKALNLQKASDLAGDIACLEFAV